MLCCNVLPFLCPGMAAAVPNSADGVMPRETKQKQHDACKHLLHHVLLWPASNELFLLLQVNRNCNCCLLITQQGMCAR
jgi:hypothetical protein